MPALKPPENEFDLKAIQSHINVIIKRFKMLPPKDKAYVLEKLNDLHNASVCERNCESCGCE